MKYMEIILLIVEVQVLFAKKSFIEEDNPSGRVVAVGGALYGVGVDLTENLVR